MTWDERENAPCASSFPHSEPAKCLEPAMMQHLDRLEAGDAVGKANLPGYSACPFCYWGCVLANPSE